MTQGNGTPTSPILSLDAARVGKMRKGNDFITVQQAYDLIIQECAKVHEHYLTQIPQHVARMVQDALLDYQLTKIVLGDDNVPIIVAHFDPRPVWERPIAPVDAPSANAETPPVADMATGGDEGDEVGNAS